MSRPAPVTLRHRPYFGTEDISGEAGHTLEDRSGRCFELSCYALTLGTAPPDSTLVHGSIQGPYRDAERIAHAWVELPNGKVWEPLRHEVYLNFYEYALAMPERRYDIVRARRLTLSTGHWGPWHTPTYRSRDADGIVRGRSR